MKKSGIMSISLTAIVLFMSLASAANAANNYADATSSYRVCPIRYAKVIYDAGPWSAFTIQKIGDRSSILIWNWHSEDNSKEFLEGAISTTIAKGVDIGLVQDEWRGTEDNTYAMLDVSKGWTGLGILMPVGKAGGTVKIGPRVNLGANFIGFASLCKSEKPYIGLGYYKGKTSLDVTVGPDRSWWFRASRPFAHGKETFVPELRLRGSEGEIHIGFGFGVSY
jgi:hypothetical protein